MKLIAGLGNPGKKYDKTKHNTGFMALDHYLNKNNLNLDKDKFDGLWTKQKINGEDVIFLEPQTFMNDSGIFWLFMMIWICQLERLEFVQMENQEVIMELKVLWLV